MVPFGATVLLAAGLTLWATRPQGPSESAAPKTEPREVARPQEEVPQQPVRAGALTVATARFQFAIFHLPKPTQPSVARAAVVARGARLDFRGTPSTQEPPHSTLYAHVESTKSYPPPLGEKFQHTTRSLSDETLKALAASEQVTVLDFQLSPPSFTDLRRAYAVAGDLAAATGGVLWDEETSELFSLQDWNTKRLSAWSQGIPPGMRHFAMHLNELPGGEATLATAGLSKFGLPEVQVAQAPAALQAQLAALVNVTAQTLIEQQRLAEPGKLTVALASLQHQELRELLSQAKQPEAPGQVTLGLTYAEKSGPHSPRAVVLDFPSTLGGSTLPERMQLALDALFGAPALEQGAQKK